MGSPPANKFLFAGGPPANKNLFAGGPPANKKLFAGGPPANKTLFAGALSILYSPEWSCTVLLGFCYTLWFYTVFKVIYCCIMVLFSLVLYGRARSCIVFFGCVWSIRSCQVLYDIIENYTVLEGPVCSCRFLFGHTLSSV